MKKITLLFFLLMSTWYAKSQVVAYTFSQSSGTYSEITGGTVLGTTTSDDQRFVDPDVPAGGTTNTGVGLPIGFDFIFNGDTYDRFAINNNGWISLGKSSLGAAAVNINSSSAYTPLSSTSTSVTDELVARIAGLGKDLQAQTDSSLSYELIGTAPNRTLVVQFKNYKKYGTNGTGDSFNFQIRINETTNVVEIVYGSMVCNATTGTYDVGLRATPSSVASNFNARTSTTSWASTSSSLVATEAVTMINTNVPASGLTFTWTPPTCPGVASLTTSNITNNSATITWQAPAPTAPSGGYEYSVSSTSTAPSGSGTVETGTTASLSGLMANTTYYVYIRTNCGTEMGNWILVGTFKTKCDEVTEFTQNFDTSLIGSTNPMPDCWDRAGTGSTYVTNGSVAPMSPSNRLYMFASGTTSTEGFAILPAVSNLQANTHRLKLVAYSTSADRFLEIGYLTDPSDVATFVSLQEITLPGTTASSAQEFIVIPGALPAGVKHLAIKNPGFPSASTIAYIDNVQWEVIPATAPVCATNIVATPDAACGNYATVITWTASANTDGYNLTVGTTAGGSDVLNNVSIGNVTTYAFIGNFNTTYYYTLTPFNAVGSATGCVEQTFTTFVTGCYCPSVPTSNDASGITNVQIGTTNFPNTDVTYFDHSATPVDMFQGISNNVQISFATGYTYNTYVWIDLNNNFTFEATELMYTGESASPNPSVLNASFVIPATAPLGSHKMRIVTADDLTTPNPCYSGSWGVTLDFMVNIIVPPSCLPPTSSTTSAITNNSATFTWSGATAANYEVLVQTAGGAAPATANDTGVNVAGMTHNATSLLANTAYEYYVRSECTLGTDFSTWAGPFTFTTLCDPYSIPYNEGFEVGYTQDAAVAGCLSQSSSIGTQVWSANNTLTTYNRAPRTGAWNAYLRYSNTDWLYIPVTLVGGTTYTASVYARQDDATATDSNVGISYGSTNDAAGMTNVIVAPTGIINGDYQLITGNFTPATSGVYFVGIKGFMNGAPWYISIDDISIVETPTCAAPTGDAAQTICGSGTLADLAVTGDSIVWHDALTGGNVLPSTTSLVTGTTYYASQNLSTCINGARLAVEVTVMNTPDTPTGNAVQTIAVDNETDATLEDVVVSPTNVVWYASEADALAGNNPLAVTTQLVTGTTYYAVNTVGACSSAPFGVTVTVTLGVNGFDNANFVAYPNPVKDNLNLSYSSNITSVKVINLLGQEVISKTINATSSQLDMSSLEAGTYLVQVAVEDYIKTIKIVKE